MKSKRNQNRMREKCETEEEFESVTCVSERGKRICEIRSATVKLDDDVQWIRDCEARLVKCEARRLTVVDGVSVTVVEGVRRWKK
ncbi:hypothetical protein MTR_8g107343 [Medicago truncatula]|uniref:Uncharacterized protein n=1 Tax=Medicago truncatula TaxID=3880 RepID=A0A072TX55_MEDTR|nr:hypothetical protein MTR_8g107343 [Medicago truncatula]